jgi:hypothetical protein
LDKPDIVTDFQHVRIIPMARPGGIFEAILPIEADARH